MQKLLRGIFYSLFLSISFSSLSQSTDYQLWTGASAQIKVGKKIRFGIEQQFRFKDTISSFKNTFTAGGIKWKLSKRFALKAVYRFTIVPNDNNHGRVSTDLIYSWDKKKFPLRVKNRFRYQRRSDFNSTKRTSYFRNKLLFEYNLSKIVDPFIAGEIFYRLNGKNEFRVWRINTGLTWRLSKQMRLKTYYQFEQEFNMKSNDRIHTIGVDLMWKIN
jgi:ribosomal protein S30